MNLTGTHIMHSTNAGAHSSKALANAMVPDTSSSCLISVPIITICAIENAKVHSIIKKVDSKKLRKYL